MNSGRLEDGTLDFECFGFFELVSRILAEKEGDCEILANPEVIGERDFVDSKGKSGKLVFQNLGDFDSDKMGLKLEKQTNTDLEFHKKSPLAFDNPKRSKNFYEEYLNIVNFTTYVKVSEKCLMRYLLLTGKVNFSQFFVHNEVRKSGFHLESGLSFGFDFVAYRKRESQGENKAHRHSVFALDIVDASSGNFSYREIQRKQRLCTNSKKVYKVALIREKS